MKNASLVVAMVIGCFSMTANAAVFRADARLFAGITTAAPGNLNQEMKAQGLNDFKSIMKYGVEITYPVTSFLNGGLRYTKRYVSTSEISPAGANFYGLINQDSVSLIARAPLVNGDAFRFDIFGGVGGTNTSFTIKTATQAGNLDRRDSGDWFSTLTTTAGASVGVGHKSFFVYVEGGYESNKVDSFKRSGNINGNIQTIDLSGPYVMLGLMFNGVTASTKTSASNSNGSAFY